MTSAARAGRFRSEQGGASGSGGMLGAALALAARGWPVFPLVAGGKVPLLAGGHGCLDATRLVHQIAVWWRSHPHANIGLATGAPSGLYVVDVDETKGGRETMARLAAEHGRLPDTLRSRTGSGWHLFFRLPSTPVRQGTDVLGPGVDTRSTGGYVVAPPSIHPSGARYRWLADVDPAPLPPWLTSLCATRPVAPPPPSAPRRLHAEVGAVERARRYLAALPPAIQGQNGSGQAMWAAVCLVRGFELDPELALNLLETDFNPRCDPPWSKRELRHKVESAERSSKPRGFLLDAPRRTA